MVAGLIASGQIDAGIGCGVEAMSRVSLGAALAPGTGMPMPDDFTLDMPDQFTAAERIAAKYGITREAADHLGLVSQQRAAPAWAERTEERRGGKECVRTCRSRGWTLT